MNKATRLFIMLLIICVTLSGCYQIDSTSQADYPGFYEEMKESFSMLPVPSSMESIDDIYLYYSDYDLIDSYYTIYLECSFSPEQFESEKQRVMEDASQYDFAVVDSDTFLYDSVCVNNCLVSDSDGFIAIQISYVLFDAENYKMIYVDTFEEGIKTEWKSALIPEKYLPKDMIDLIM